MKRLRISGLVRLAKRVRQELAGPVSAERLARLRREIDGAIRTVEQFAREQGVPVQSLPLPSRKAYLFLKGLDLSAIATQEDSSANRVRAESIWFRGLRSYFDSLLNQIARSNSPSQWEDAYREIVVSSENIEAAVKAKNFQPEQIKKVSREMRGWLAYLAERENFEEYRAAVQRAEPIFREACTWPTAKSAAILVHFRPQPGMYRIRGSSDAIVVRLPTPMISFDEHLLQSVAALAFKKGGDKKLVLNAIQSEPYQRILSALELLGGVVTQTRGMHHDLSESFDRVNAAYFNGGMSRPRLAWSRTFAARKFGHYDHAHDTVMVNMVLDRKSVPDLAVDFIMYHELLHKQLGIIWRSNRMAAHTPEFRQREREFKEYDQAKGILNKLAAER